MDLEDLSKTELVDLVKKLRSKKKYGLVWEDEKTREHFDFDPSASLPIFVEDKKKVVNDKSNENSNYLIEGDNYFALSLLRYTHSNKIDFIYIDPPYNTGNKDFKYNDSYVDREDTFQHSKWISFMSKRLELAKDLLASEGVIFVSIGDDEQANLKLLMDEIFGENNFVNCVPRLAKTSSDRGTFYAPSKDYLLVYKSPYRTEKFNDVLDDDYKNRFKNKDERGHFATVGLYQAALDSRPNQRYWIECPDGSFIIPPGNVFPKKIKDGEHITPINNEDKVWRWSYDSYLKQKHLLVFKKSKRSPMLNEKKQKSEWNVDTKYYLEDRQESGKRPRDWVDKFLNTEGSNEIKRYGLDFSYPKPTSLIKYLITISHSRNDINVLDFFAGSGTTGDAVLQLNSEDGGSRKFILVTNNEDNICTEVTHPRLEKVSKGYTDTSKKKIEGLGGTIRYFKIDFVAKTLNQDEMKIRLTENVIDLLKLSNSAFEEVSTKKEDYKIFKSPNELVGIYHAFDPSSLDDFRNELLQANASKIKIYLFTFDDELIVPEELEELSNVEIEPIPQRLLSLLGAINV